GGLRGRALARGLRAAPNEGLWPSVSSSMRRGSLGGARHARPGSRACTVRHVGDRSARLVPGRATGRFRGRPQVLGDRRRRTRVPGVLAQANPVAGPLRLWLEDEVGVDVDDIAEVELARADLVGAVRMPQRNAVLAADPRAMRVETARAVGREHGAGVTGAVRSGAREDVVPRFGGEPGEPVAEVVAFERRDGEGLRAAPAAP